MALAYEEAGSGAPPIMLVHDLGSDHTCFASQFEHFRGSHRVVAVDLRGHGQSDKPGEPYTVAVLADDLAWLCYELGLYRPILLGHGLGGTVALDLGARYPSLVAAVVVVPNPSRAITPAPHQQAATPRLESGSTCGHIAAIDGSSVPVLYITPSATEMPSDRRHRAGPRLASRESAAWQRKDAIVPEVVSLLVDRFLLGLTDRASP